MLVSRDQMKKMLKYIFPIICWGGVIFFFSSQTYQEQNLTPLLDRMFQSDRIKELLSHISFHYHSREISVQNLGVAHFIEFFIRKFAHLFVFFIFGLLIVRALFNKMDRSLLASILSLLLVIIYAGFDELHQMYTGGRTPLLTDVYIDTIGGLIGIITYMFVIKRN